jgi:UDP-glucose 4-epimerase
VTGLAWVVGRGGLLGSHVERAAAAVESPIFGLGLALFPWRDPTLVNAALHEAARSFVRAVSDSGHDGWTVFWCAGAGVVGTKEAELEQECRTFEAFLASLGDALAASPTRVPPGRVFLASSAGGVYGGNPGRPCTEATEPRPISPYGRAKLAQEAALARWVEAHAGISALVGRISNLYGPGQNMSKPQGLISHMSRSVIHRLPIHVYVPLDTLRDYLFVTDAAKAIVRWVARLAHEPRRMVTKVCASEQETTITSLIQTFRRIARKQVKVVCGLHPVQNQQPLVLQFRSVEWTDDPLRPSTSLLAGIERVYRSHLQLHMAGRLPPPSPLRV